LQLHQGAELQYYSTARSLPRPKESISHVMREEAGAKRGAVHNARRAHQMRCEGPVAMVPCASLMRMSANLPNLKVCLHEGSKRTRKRNWQPYPRTPVAFSPGRGQESKKSKRTSKYISQEKSQCAERPHVRRVESTVEQMLIQHCSPYEIANRDQDRSGIPTIRSCRW